MKRAITLASILALSMSFGGAAQAVSGDIGKGPVVTSEWLATHQHLKNLVLIDIRTAEEYTAGHIANAINIPLVVPISAWITMRDDLLLELPDAADLFAMLGSFGIRQQSRVVVITSFGEPPYPQANANRVVATLNYAGVRDVSVLDGGYPVWVAEGRPSTTEVPVVTPSTYSATVNGATFVTTDYVADHIGQSILVDARDAAVYAGEVVEPWADKAGHIPTAVSLPAPSIWAADGSYRSVPDLRAMVRAAIGPHHRQDEIIVYCGVGGYAGSWLFVLSKLLGYTNVKMYDGSAQEWVRTHDMVL